MRQGQWAAGLTSSAVHSCSRSAPGSAQGCALASGGRKGWGLLKNGTLSGLLLVSALQRNTVRVSSRCTRPVLLHVDEAASSRLVEQQL